MVTKIDHLLQIFNVYWWYIKENKIYLCVMITFKALSYAFIDLHSAFE